MNWTHPICSACWCRLNADRTPHRMKLPEEERCAFCGELTVSGIYVRADPASVPYPGEGVVSEFPPPAPVLWAPKFRKYLHRFLTRMDRRKARHLAEQNRNVQEVIWQRAYREWWDTYGWAQGAPTPEKALHNLRGGR